MHVKYVLLSYCIVTVASIISRTVGQVSDYILAIRASGNLSTSYVAIGNILANSQTICGWSWLKSVNDYSAKLVFSVISILCEQTT